MSARRWDYYKLSFLGLTAFSAVIFLLHPTTAYGQDKWWQKGEALLKGAAESKTVGSLSIVDIAGGLKDALRVGTENVVGQLGKDDGFNADSNIHIPLPDTLGKVKSILGKVGMSGMLDDLELKLNRAAEAATPQAKSVFWNAIAQMTLDDAKAIYSGPQDAATKYFQEKMTPALAEAMRPIVQNSLSQVGAVQSYNNVMSKYKSIPLVPDVSANISDYVVKKGMDGIFYYLAKEEAAIRANPAKQTTDLLKKVFGGRK